MHADWPRTDNGCSRSGLTAGSSTARRSAFSPSGRANSARGPPVHWRRRPPHVAVTRRRRQAPPEPRGARVRRPLQPHHLGPRDRRALSGQAATRRSTRSIRGRSRPTTPHRLGLIRSSAASCSAVPSTSPARPLGREPGEATPPDRLLQAVLRNTSCDLHAQGKPGALERQLAAPKPLSARRLAPEPAAAALERRSTSAPWTSTGLANGTTPRSPGQRNSHRGEPPPPLPHRGRRVAGRSAAYPPMCAGEAVTSIEPEGPGRRDRFGGCGRKTAPREAFQPAPPDFGPRPKRTEGTRARSTTRRTRLTRTRARRPRRPTLCSALRLSRGFAARSAGVALRPSVLDHQEPPGSGPRDPQVDRGRRGVSRPGAVGAADARGAARSGRAGHRRGLSPRRQRAAGRAEERAADQEDAERPSRRRRRRGRARRPGTRATDMVSAQVGPVSAPQPAAWPGRTAPAARAARNPAYSAATITTPSRSRTAGRNTYAGSWSL